MRTIHSIAQSLEEASREDEQEGKWYARPLAFCINSSLADKLSGPLRYVCFSPLVVLIVIAVLYVLFLIVFCPLWLLSYIITVAGSYLVFFVMFHYLAVYITRSIAFPGSTTAAQQQISAEVLRRIAAYLDGLASSTNEVCALLILVFAGQLDVAEVQSIQREILSIWMSAQYLPNIFYGVSQAVDFLKHEKKLSPEETISVNQLTKGMEDFSNTLQNLLNALTQNDVRKLQDRSFVSRLAKELPFRAQELSNSTGRCLAASESLRVSAGIVRPKPSGDDESDILGMIRPLLAWNSGVTGYDQLAFPFMRALLQRTYGAKIFSVKGSNDNFVDCLYINAEEARSIRAARASGSEYQAPPASATPVHSNKLVLFCGPNAGFFETIAQMDYETSWCGYYVSKGIDFVAFNYRGYGRSTGSPTPTALKADSIKVFDHVMKTYRPKTVLIHGESIGGMVACHLARNCAVNAVLCDRTFGSLDAAARRIMAQWAGSAVKYLALWNTNVIDDYLSVSCAKLVIQV